MTLLPLSALAHAQMVRSQPADRATIRQSPPQLNLWFNELLENAFNVIEVFPSSQLEGGTRTNLAEGQAKVDPKDPTHLAVKVKPLVPGEYVAEWRVLSRDGHIAPGRIRFQVLAPR